MKQMIIAVCLQFFVVAIAVLTADAETIPFWGDANPATNRTSASSQTVALAPGFESRLCAEADSALARFSSMSMGALFMIR